MQLLQVGQRCVCDVQLLLGSLALALQQAVKPRGILLRMVDLLLQRADLPLLHRQLRLRAELRRVSEARMPASV